MAVSDNAKKRAAKKTGTPAATTPHHPRIDIWAPAVIGIIGLGISLYLVQVNPHPTPEQWRVYLIVLALSAAAFAAVIPGLLDANVKWPGLTIRASGAIGVFCLVMYYPPARETLANTVLGKPEPLVQTITKAEQLKDWENFDIPIETPEAANIQINATLEVAMSLDSKFVMRNRVEISSGRDHKECNANETSFDGAYPHTTTSVLCTIQIPRGTTVVHLHATQQLVRDESRTLQQVGLQFVSKVRGNVTIAFM